jgi:hypothetical protein
MNNLRHLIADADLEITHDSGSRISIQLTDGRGVVELHDNRLLRTAFRNLRTKPRQEFDLLPYLPLVQQLEGRIDLAVGGRRVACLDSSKKADFFCRYLGVPGCRIKPFALLLSLLRPQTRSRPKRV